MNDTKYHKIFNATPSKENNMKIKVSNKITKDTFYTMVPLNWILRVFNLSCIYRKNGELKVSWSLTKNIIYVVTFSLVNLFFLLNNIEKWGSILHNWSLLTFSDAIQMTYFIGYVEYIIDLVYIYKNGRESLLKYFKSFDAIDQLLGMNSYDEIRWQISKTVGICFIMFVISSAIDYVSWVDAYKMSSPFLFTFNYFYFFLNMLSALDGMSYVVQLEYRLKVMKDLLEKYYNSSNQTKGNDEDKTWATKNDSESHRVDSLKTLNYSRFTEVIGFNRCYLLLLDQTYFMNHRFGFRLLVLCINFLVNMIKLLNLAIRFATGSMVPPYGTSSLLSFASIVRLLNWAIVAIIVVYRCERIYGQSEKILKIIDLVLINKTNSTSLTTTLEKFRNLLLTRPIKFHAVQFFTIEYTLLVSLASTVVTYTIIMLQNMQ